MTFALFNNRAVEIDRDSWSEEPVRVGAVDKQAIDGSLLSIEGTTRRRWRGTVKVMLASTAVKVQQWLEGRGQAWSFASGEDTSVTGISNHVAGTVSYLTTTGRLSTFTGVMSIALGSVWGVRMINKMGVRRGWTPTANGFTFCFWTYRTVAADGVAADGWYFMAVVGATTWSRGTANPGGITQYRSSVGSPGTDPASGSFSLGYICQVNTTSPYAAVHGYTLANATAVKLYQDLMFVPYQMTAAEVASIYHLTRAGGVTTNGLPVTSLCPFVYLDGDCLEDAAPVLCRVRVEKIDLFNARLPEDPGNVHRSNHRILHIVAEEL